MADCPMNHNSEVKSVVQLNYVCHPQQLKLNIFKDFKEYSLLFKEPLISSKFRGYTAEEVLNGIPYGKSGYSGSAKLYYIQVF